MEKTHVTWGDTSKHLPWSCVSGGTRRFTRIRARRHAAASDAILKLQQIAAKDLGGRPEDYVVAKERVARKGGGAGMTLAKAAQRAIELGGIYDGHELPKDINAVTTRSATALAGQGLMGVAKDNYKRDGATYSFCAAFAEVEVDVETGVYDLLDYHMVADVGTVIHPRALGAQILGRSILGIGHAIGHKWVYDQRYGRPSPNGSSEQAADTSRSNQMTGRLSAARSRNTGGAKASANQRRGDLRRHECDSDAWGELFRRGPVTPTRRRRRSRIPMGLTCGKV